MSDCRVQKRASASLSLRLPRSRPPAVGIDNSFLMTPPSAEATTPTKETKPPVQMETVEKSIVLEAKEKPVDGSPTVETSKLPDYSGERLIPVVPEAETVVEVNGDSALESVNNKAGEQAKTFVLAEWPDLNPNPHS